MGNRFHLLANQYLSGIQSGEQLENSIDDPELKGWFNKFQIYIKRYKPFPFFSEFTAIMPFEEFRLIAVFDFISLTDDNKLMIGDWKTTSRLPKREVYSQSIQSYLYPFLAFETREHIFIQAASLKPQDLFMEYWFPNFPENTITLEYSNASHIKNREILSSLINEIAIKDVGTFEKTSNEKRCDFLPIPILMREEVFRQGKSKMQKMSLRPIQICPILILIEIEEISF